MLTDYFASYVDAYAPYKDGRWCYEDGCIYRGLELLHRTTGDDHWLQKMKIRVDAQIEDGPSLRGYDPSEYNIDNVQAGRALLYLHQVTGTQLYLDAAALLIDQLNTHPRTKTGVYWHKLRYPWQVWLDGLYMGPPFQIGFGLQTGNPDLVEDSIQQVATALEMTWVEQTGLYAHAMDEARKQPWANKTNGHNQAHWARAIGWLAMGLVDIAELVGPSKFQPVRQRTRDLLSRVAELRVPDGMWRQVIDQHDLDGNFEESSASAMFIYALIKGADLGLYDGVVDGLFNCLTERMVKPRAGGGWEMTDICWVAGLGMFEGRIRDGSAEYYLSERTVCDDAKGVGPLMMAFAADHSYQSSRAKLAVNT